MANKLMAGVGEALIRFPMEMFPTEGYKGIHDDPHARVLVMDCGERAVIISMEIVALPKPYIQKIKKMAEEKFGTKAENVLVHVTHAISTPHCPSAVAGTPKTEELEKKDKIYEEAVISAVSEAIDKAADMREAVIGVGTGYCDVNTNRDFETPNGWWIGFNPNGLSNKTATVIKVEGTDGKLIALLINYGLKPCAIDNSEKEKVNRLVSSDLPGYACNKLEEKYGAPCLYLTGGAGDQTSKEQAWYDAVDENGNIYKVDLGVQKGLEIVQRLGEQMTADMITIIDEITCTESAPSVHNGYAEITLPGKARMDMAPRKTAEFVQEGEVVLRTDLVTVGDIAFVGVKPECSVKTELELKEKSVFTHTLLMNMTNGGIKYMPDKAGYDVFSWEAQNSSVMPGSAEKWADNVCEALKNLK